MLNDQRALVERVIKSNREFWIAKMERKRQRDQEVNPFDPKIGRYCGFGIFEVKGEGRG
jgi:DNA mismatch endonuclease (patch repair protein)